MQEYMICIIEIQKNEKKSNKMHTNIYIWHRQSHGYADIPEKKTWTCVFVLQIL